MPAAHGERVHAGYLVIVLMSPSCERAGLEVFQSKYLYHERRMTSVANATRKDGEELLRVAADIPVRTTVQTFPLEAANDVLRLLKAGKVNGAAVLRIS